MLGRDRLFAIQFSFAFYASLMLRQAVREADATGHELVLQAHIPFLPPSPRDVVIGKSH